MLSALYHFGTEAIKVLSMPTDRGTDLFQNTHDASITMFYIFQKWAPLLLLVELVHAGECVRFNSEMCRSLS